LHSSHITPNFLSKYLHASCKHILTQKIMQRLCCCCAIESALRSVKSRFGFLAQTGQCNTKESVLQQLFLHISLRYLAYGFTIYFLKFLSPKVFAEWMCPLTITNLSFGCYSDTWITVLMGTKAEKYHIWSSVTFRPFVWTSP
jgi:hypothetical protein